MSTIHIEASPEDFADTVLMPGDPLRAEYIARHFLEDAQQINRLRNMLAFTGMYQGRRISVMGSGMGIPSISLYAHELFNEFDVQSIIRVGSCGAMQPAIQLGDVVIAMGACTDSNVNRVLANGADFAAIAGFELLQNAVASCSQQGLRYHVGNVYSTDSFYADCQATSEAMTKLGVLAVEMEAAGLYGVAARLGRKALAINTVSDHLLDDTHLEPQARQSGFNQMIELALTTAAAKKILTGLD